EVLKAAQQFGPHAAVPVQHRGRDGAVRGRRLALQPVDVALLKRGQLFASGSHFPVQLDPVGGEVGIFEQLVGQAPLGRDEGVFPQVQGAALARQVVKGALGHGLEDALLGSPPQGPLPQGGLVFFPVLGQRKPVHGGIHLSPARRRAWTEFGWPAACFSATGGPGPAPGGPAWPGPVRQDARGPRRMETERLYWSISRRLRRLLLCRRRRPRSGCAPCCGRRVWTRRSWSLPRAPARP